MTMKAARKILSDSGFTVQQEDGRFLLWGYSPQGVPSSFLFFNVPNTSLKSIAACCEVVRKSAVGYMSPHNQQLEIRDKWCKR